MATEYLSVKHTAGNTVYFCVFSLSDGEVFDFDDNTWKADFASCTTPQLGAFEQGDMGDADESLYTAPVNLSLLHNAVTVKQVLIQAVEDLATDEVIAEEEMLIAEGERVGPGYDALCAEIAAISGPHYIYGTVETGQIVAAGGLADYTYNADIIRGSRWPPAEDVLTVAITNSGGWPAGADGWTWTLQLSRTQRGTTPDLELTADSANVAGNVLTLTFHATSAETAALPAGKGRYYVEVKSDDGDDPAVVSYYDCVAGTANVRDAAGEG